LLKTQSEKLNYFNLRLAQNFENKAAISGFSPEGKNINNHGLSEAKPVVK